MVHRPGNRVLLAGDNSIVRDSRADIEICGETSDGRETIEKAFAPRPDLLILDVVMPELNGIEVATILKASLPEMKTILFYDVMNMSERHSQRRPV